MQTDDGVELNDEIAILREMSDGGQEQSQMGRPIQHRHELQKAPALQSQPLSGAGSGGLVSAYIAAAVKAKVALIEKDKMGGDCLNTGCVPSKALIRSAKMVSYARRAADFGFRSGQVEYDFAEVMERVQRVIEKVEPHDSIERYTELGVECFTGTAKIVSPWAVEVNGETLTAKSIIIATGARPLVPPIKGIEEVNYLTSDNLWQLRQNPARFIMSMF